MGEGNIGTFANTKREKMQFLHQEAMARRSFNENYVEGRADSAIDNTVVSDETR